MANPKVNAPEFPPGLDWFNAPRPLTLQELRGKVVLLDFWAYCCINCHHNIAQLRRLHHQFPQELVIIGVHSAKFPAEKLAHNIRQAVMRHRIPYPVVNDADMAIWQEYTIRAWPSLVLIDPAGQIVETQSGEFLAQEYSPKIKQLIDRFEQKEALNRTPLELQPARQAEPARPRNYPSTVLIGPDGRLFIADTGHHRILEVQLAGNGLVGEIVRVFGSGQPGLRDGPPTQAMFRGPRGLALIRASHTLYVADTENHAIRAIDLDEGQVRTVAGTGQKAHGNFALGRPSTQIPLRSPWALLAKDKIIFIAMAGSHQVWILMDEKELALFFGNGREALVDGTQMEASFNQPSGLAIGNNQLFVVDAEASAIRRIDLSQQPTRAVTLVGQGLFEFGDVDGPGPQARLQHPTGLAFARNRLYIADSYNHKIKVLDPVTTQLQTLIGSGQPGHANGSFARAELFQPQGIAASTNRLYIADTNNHLVRIADLATGILHTLSLRSLERLRMTPAEARPADKRLEPLVVTPGRVTLTFKINLPPGHKLHPTMPVLLHLKRDSIHIDHTFQPTDTTQVTILVEVDQDLTIDLTLYYCQAEADHLCLIHDIRLVVPLSVEEGGQANISIPYTVPGSPPAEN